MSLEHALKYCQAGASVIPVARDKKPLIRWREFQVRTPATEELQAWYNRWPQAGIAVVCGRVSNLCVLDVEQKAIPELLDLGIPDTPTVRTQGGGLHFYFTYCPRLRSTTWSVDGRHCGELRSDGNYVVAPPSAGLTGVYSWIRHPAMTEMGSPPAWLYELQNPRQTGWRRERSRELNRFPSRSEEDESLALAMVLEGASPADIIACLVARPAARNRSNPLDYCRRTELSARSFARRYFAHARVIRVRKKSTFALVSFRMESGNYVGRTLVRKLDWPVTARSEHVWTSMVAVRGKAVRRPEDLHGLQLVIGVFERDDRVAIEGRAFPVCDGWEGA